MRRVKLAVTHTRATRDVMASRWALVALVAAWVAVGCTRKTAVAPVAVGPHTTAPSPDTLSGEPRVLFAEAVAHVEAGKDDEARPLFLGLLERYPDLEDYHLAYLAAIEERAGHLTAAAAFDDRLVASHPDSVWIPSALARRGAVAAALGDPRAGEFAARALASPDADTATRAAALVVQGDLSAADDPRGAYALYQEARRCVTKTAARARERSMALEHAHPELLEDSRLLLSEGTLLLAEGRLDLAATRLGQAATVAVTSAARAAALRALARVRVHQERIDEAIATYGDAAAAEAPPGGDARFELATLLWNRDRDAEADRLFRNLLRDTPLHPKRDTARYALGRIAEQAGNQAEANAHYRRLIATGTDAGLIRESRWRIAWARYRNAQLGAALEAFARLAREGVEQTAALYWLGRAHERRDGAAASAALYRDVLAHAPESYYADLSEQRLGQSLPPLPPPVPLAGLPPPGLLLHAYHWTRSRELHAASLDRAAARELDAVARAFAPGSDEQLFLLEAYREVDAHGRALRLAEMLKHSGRLPDSSSAAYLYPRAYWHVVSPEAAAARLDPYLVLAVIRQESRFDPHAESPAAAHGLMQLLVRTASRVAESPVSAASLTDPATNVHLGARYLRQLLDRYAGDLVKALAAYNAGEDAVIKWEARAPGVAADEFVETISFRETRRYVKAVLANYRHYRRLYGALGEARAVALAAGTCAASSPRRWAEDHPLDGEVPEGALNTWNVTVE
jgi:soluble lytic murein transglycosylase